MKFNSIIVEGIDRLGKDTLIGGLLDTLGYFQILHFQKPQLLSRYSVQTDADWKKKALKEYQEASFINMFKMLSSDARFILNRSHLGEFVYAPRYRGYGGEYVFDLEQAFISMGSTFHERTLLVLLHTSSFGIVKDDGESFDFNKKEEEQDDFVRAFNRSAIKNKLSIDVYDGQDGFASKEDILKNVLEMFVD